MRIAITALPEGDREYFQQFYEKHTVTGDLLQEWRGASEMYSDHIIIKGGWTPFGCARDCGDHYILARYSRYDRIDKDTFKVTEDVEDR